MTPRQSRQPCFLLRQRSRNDVCLRMSWENCKSGKDTQRLWDTEDTEGNQSGSTIRVCISVPALRSCAALEKVLNSSGP